MHSYVNINHPMKYLTFVTNTHKCIQSIYVEKFTKKLWRIFFFRMNTIKMWNEKDLSDEINVTWFWVFHSVSAPCFSSTSFILCKSKASVFYWNHRTKHANRLKWYQMACYIVMSAWNWNWFLQRCRRRCYRLRLLKYHST